MSATEYGPTDVARHALLRLEDHGPELDAYLAERWWTGGYQAVRVGTVVADVCAVGHGGHYDEVLEDDREGEVMSALAEHLAPLYCSGDESEAYLLLTIVRDEWCKRLREEVPVLLDRWAHYGFEVSGVEAEA